MLLWRDHFAWQLQEFVCLGSTFWWQAQTFDESSWKSPKRIGILEFWGQAFGPHVVFEGSLAGKLRFGASKLHFWRKSRRKASFWSFKASFLKEVWQKSFVFESDSYIFERSLAEKASFLSFNVSILKKVSQKSFVFEPPSFIFVSWFFSQFVIQPVRHSVSQLVA